MARPRQKPFADDVRRAMQALGVRSLKGLAERLGQPVATVTNWQKRGKVPVEWVEKISLLSGVPIDALSGQLLEPPFTWGTAGPVRSEERAVALTARETLLIDNYRRASEAGRKALEQTSIALAEEKSHKKG